MFKGWRRFRARSASPKRMRESALLPATREVLETVLAEHSLGRQATAQQLDPVIDYVRTRAHTEMTKELWFALLLLQSPRAAAAQEYMDKHAHDYHQKNGKLFELIDFNDAFVSTVLLLSPMERDTFIVVAKQEMQAFCKRVNAHMLTDEQFEAITRGLSKEVAVYLGAIDQGFQAEMTSRDQDAMGVDLIVTDAATGSILNIDCKTPSAYRYRIEDLVQQGRLNEQEGRQADNLGYVMEENGHNDDAVMVTVFRVDPNEVGDITNFTFDDSSRLGDRLRAVFHSSKKSENKVDKKT
ncbi:MAG: hypothetical protein ABIR46_02735 [Candidatus Saccharimonadales bacterium]